MICHDLVLAGWVEKHSIASVSTSMATAAPAMHCHPWPCTQLTLAHGCEERAITAETRRSGKHTVDVLPFGTRRIASSNRFPIGTQASIRPDSSVRPEDRWAKCGSGPAGCLRVKHLRQLPESLRCPRLCRRPKACTECNVSMAPYTPFWAITRPRRQTLLPKITRRGPNRVPSIVTGRFLAILAVGILACSSGSWSGDPPEVPTPEQLQLLQQRVAARAALVDELTIENRI